MLGRRSSSICQKGISFPDQGRFIHYGGCTWERKNERKRKKKKKKLKKVSRRVGTVVADLGTEGRLLTVT